MSQSMSLREIEDLGFSLQDNICVFCSLTMDRWDSICRRCKEYKGVVNIVSAVGYYGKDILPIQGKCQTYPLQYPNNRKEN